MDQEIVEGVAVEPEAAPVEPAAEAPAAPAKRKGRTADKHPSKVFTGIIALDEEKTPVLSVKYNDKDGVRHVGRYAVTVDENDNPVFAKL